MGVGSNWPGPTFLHSIWSVMDPPSARHTPNMYFIDYCGAKRRRFIGFPAEFDRFSLLFAKFLTNNGDWSQISRGRRNYFSKSHWKYTFYGKIFYKFGPWRPLNMRGPWPLWPFHPNSWGPWPLLPQDRIPEADHYTTQPPPNSLLSYPPQYRTWLEINKAYTKKKIRKSLKKVSIITIINVTVA